MALIASNCFTIRAFSLLVLTAVLSTARANFSVASDYYHECADASGSYRIVDEQLMPVTRETGPIIEIDYTANSKITISQERGYCISGNCGRNFEYENHQYVLDVTFEHNGARNTRAFICELASDGLPASCHCSKQITTSRKALQPAYSVAQPSITDLPDTNSSAWNHNGSTVYLLANGSERQFRYRIPRPRMRKACPKRGDIVFKGTRRGDQYVGTAYIYSCSCGPIAYDVSGKVTNNDKRVVLTGKAPGRNRHCKVTNARPDTLVFNLIEGRQ